MVRFKSHGEQEDETSDEFSLQQRDEALKVTQNTLQTTAEDHSGNSNKMNKYDTNLQKQILPREGHAISIITEVNNSEYDESCKSNTHLQESKESLYD